MTSSEKLPPLPPLIQDMLDNPPDGLVIHKYKGLGELEKAITPITNALFDHKTEEQLMMVTDFDRKYIEDGGDILRRRVYKSTRKMYFWEHRLLILQFRPCNQYSWVECAFQESFMEYCFERKKMTGDRDIMSYTMWPEGYLGLHSARQPAWCIELLTHKSSNTSLPPGLRAWPTVVFEHRSLSPLSAKYADFGIDWWFYQSQGLTKIVVMVTIDHNSRNITFEKWVCDITPPDIDTRRSTRSTGSNFNLSRLTGEQELPASSFKKRREQIVVYTVENGFDGNPIVLEFERMFHQPKKSEHNKDFLLDDAALGNYADFIEGWCEKNDC